MFAGYSLTNGVPYDAPMRAMAAPQKNGSPSPVDLPNCPTAQLGVAAPANYEAISGWRFDKCFSTMG